MSSLAHSSPDGASIPTGDAGETAPEMVEVMACDFCGQHLGRLLIEAKVLLPTPVHICSECVVVCVDVIRDKAREALADLGKSANPTAGGYDDGEAGGMNP